MNGNLQIISKGLYKGSVDRAFPIEVKEYVFSRKDGQKCLLLRFFNYSDINITALEFWLVQKNSYGEQISKEKISLDNIYCGAGKVFSPSVGFAVDNKCVDFEVEMISAFSGEYEYKSENGETFVKFSTKSKSFPYKRNAYCVQKTKINSKVKFSTAILVVAVFLVILAVIWPFFVEDALPAIKEVIKNLWKLLGEAIKSFFKMMGKLFDSKKA